MHNINALLAKSIQAYRQGLNQPVPLLDETEKASVKKLAETCMNTSLSAEEQKTCHRIMHLLNLVDNLRMQHLHEAAQNTLHEAHRNLKSKTLSRLPHLFCLAFILQAQAELSFDLKKFGQTGKYVLKALDVIRLLEQDYSMAFFHVLRLQQVLLYIRVCQRTGDSSDLLPCRLWKPSTHFRRLGPKSCAAHP